MARRPFLASLAALGVPFALPASARAATPRHEPADFPRNDPARVQSVVGSSHGNFEMVRQLVTEQPALAKASWDWGFGDWETALGAASHMGRRDIAKLLLEHGAYPNPPVESSADAVWIAIRRGDRRMLELLGSFGASMDVPFELDGTLTYQDLLATGVRLPLRMLAYYGDLAAVMDRLEQDPALARDPEALTAAAGRGHEAIARQLLRYEPGLARDVTIRGPRAMAELLFAHGMDPNRPDWLRATPLHRCAGSGDLEGAALFLDHGADLNARDEERCATPLAWAAMEGRARMVEFLLGRGARPELPDDPPWATPLAWATRRGHDDVVRILNASRPSDP
jgi:ankyrin repeat protein